MFLPSSATHIDLKTQRRLSSILVQTGLVRWMTGVGAPPYMKETLMVAKKKTSSSNKPALKKKTIKKEDLKKVGGGMRAMQACTEGGLCHKPTQTDG